MGDLPSLGAAFDKGQLILTWWRRTLDIEKGFVAFVRGQSDEAGFEHVPQAGFRYLSGYVEFWLRFIGVREVVTLTLEHMWEGRAVDMIAAGKKKAAELAKQF
jgi:FMN-dependent NADH-azoreductase